MVTMVKGKYYLMQSARMKEPVSLRFVRYADNGDDVIMSDGGSGWDQGCVLREDESRPADLLIGPSETKFREFLKSIPQQPQYQCDLSTQKRLAHDLLNRCGFYDVADLVK